MKFEVDPNGAEVVKLPTEFKEPASGERFLTEVPHSACSHLFASFTVDMSAGKCICSKCSGEVSPMFVLEQLMKQESRWMRTRAAYLDEMKRLEARSRTKCRKCGEMTPVSRS